ncbi:MAG: DUF4177 domain-containing protein, partial [Opitutaceae bacterium]|nr:DUF4177 domain-containing protein [Opitutaceae bacterium]
MEISLGKPRAIWDALCPSPFATATAGFHPSRFTPFNTNLANQITMAFWEYKVITSGIHGFATPALLESYLNTLGKDEWEVVNYQPSPTNPLAFTGLVRRTTQRDWLPPAAATSPQQQPHTPDHKPHAGGANNPPHPESATDDTPAPARASEILTGSQRQSDPLKSETPPPPAGAIRPVRDTERDLDPEALAEEDDDNNDATNTDNATNNNNANTDSASATTITDDDEWDILDTDDDLPTFFDALKPHMRGNLKGPGQSVGVDYLVKRWNLREAEVLGALKECGLTIPETEGADPEYFEFEDDLFWVNRNNRGQFFINTREKPRPIFRTVTATPLSPDDPAYAELATGRAEEKNRVEKRNAEYAAMQAAAAARAEEAARRRAAQQTAAATAKDNTEAHPAADTTPAAATPAADTTAPAADTTLTTNTTPATVVAPATAAPAAAAPTAESAPAADPAPEIAPPPTGAPGETTILDHIRPMMRRNRHGPNYSGSIGFLARALGIADDDLATRLIELGLPIPAVPGEKPTFVEINAVLYWLNKDNRGNIWINARENKNALKKSTLPLAAATADVAQAAKPVSDAPRAGRPGA